LGKVVLYQLSYFRVFCKLTWQVVAYPTIAIVVSYFRVSNCSNPCIYPLLALFSFAIADANIDLFFVSPK
ncbi:hypothetical protein, partial [Carboxylicivirga caseinilyticus]|uniref:hypothetical protein n=1 Tax=Carboxylicivirga caseinilyticus TaxID=3417572 RepID=UPI003D32E182|nr:hypothetical protein [Marinilabiliaceae bacterium A049]